MMVLIADDDPMTRKGLSEVLLSEGFDVIQAGNGEQAWEKYHELSPDFLCLDVMMPRMNGYELCKKIRQVNSSIPILFLTAKGEEIDKVVGLEIGADDYVVKPFAVKEVIARIRAVARRCLAYRSNDLVNRRDISEFQIGDLVVFPAELRARRGEVWIDLTPREIKILQLLVKRRGQVVERMQLMQHAWGCEYQPSSRTLDQQISQLRKRIEPDPKAPQLIETVYGVGYRYDYPT
jgi:DNA-binding response OmpR family regulator